MNHLINVHVLFGTNQRADKTDLGRWFPTFFYILYVHPYLGFHDPIWRAHFFRSMAKNHHLVMCFFGGAVSNLVCQFSAWDILWAKAGCYQCSCRCFRTFVDGSGEYHFTREFFRGGEVKKLFLFFLRGGWGNVLCIYIIYIYMSLVLGRRFLLFGMVVLLLFSGAIISLRGVPLYCYSAAVSMFYFIFLHCFDWPSKIQDICFICFHFWSIAFH